MKPVDLSSHIKHSPYMEDPAEKESRPPRFCSNPSIQSSSLHLSFNSLTYTIKSKQKWTRPTFSHERGSFGTDNTVLLNSISGEAKKGEILAILGPSGSGKSTLINALADQISREKLTGSITLNGEVLESRLLKVMSAYVKQDDILFPMLTVEETLIFAAEFRLARSLPYSEKRRRVQSLINQLGLHEAKDSMIGDDSHRGVSGGERRRVSIGIDIIHDPIILFLDEPTSGLDSTSAFKVVKVLKSKAQSGSIIIMTVHQPSFRILSCFDQLMFLSRGQTVYTGSPCNLTAFFRAFGLPVPQNESVAEFALDLILHLEESPDGTKLLVEFNKSWQDQKKAASSNMVCTNSKKLPLSKATSPCISNGKLTIDHTKPTFLATYANPISVEVIILAKRTIINSMRTPELLGLQFCSVVLAGVMLGTIFFRLDSSQRGVHERISFFASAITTTFFVCLESLPNLFNEKLVVKRETSGGAFRRTSYLLSQALTSIAYLILLSLTFAGTTFWAVGLSGGFCTFSLFVFAAFWAGQSLVALVAGVITNVMVGYAVLVSIVANFLLFSGFFIHRDRIPPYWVWLHYASPVKYPYEGVLLAEFGRDRCFVTGVEMFDATPLREAPVQTKQALLESISAVLRIAGVGNVTGEDGGECVVTGKSVLAQLGADDLGKWECFWITIGWGVMFRVLLNLEPLLLLCSKKMLIRARDP